MTSKYADPTEYSELIEYLQNRQAGVAVEGVTRRRVSGNAEGGDPYVGITCTPAGMDLWELHEEFNVDVVYSWFNPNTNRLRMGLRLRHDKGDGKERDTQDGPFDDGGEIVR